MPNERGPTALTPEEQRIWQMGYDKRDAELAPAGSDVETAEAIYKRAVLAAASKKRPGMPGHPAKLSKALETEIADALRAARGDVEAVKAAARKLLKSLEGSGMPEYVVYPHKGYVEARDALAALVAPKEE